MERTYGAYGLLYDLLDSKYRKQGHERQSTEKRENPPHATVTRMVRMRTVQPLFSKHKHGSATRGALGRRVRGKIQWLKEHVESCPDHSMPRQMTPAEQIQGKGKGRGGVTSWRKQFQIICCAIKGRGALSKLMNVESSVVKRNVSNRA